MEGTGFKPQSEKGISLLHKSLDPTQPRVQDVEGLLPGDLSSSCVALNNQHLGHKL